MIRHIIGQIHLWIGLVLCVPFVLIGLTGSILVFEDELNSALGPAARHPAAGGAARPPSDIIAAARAAAPASFVPVSYAAPGTAGQLASARLAPARRDAPGADAIRINIDPASLETFPEPQNGFFWQIFFLH